MKRARSVFLSLALSGATLLSAIPAIPAEPAAAETSAESLYAKALQYSLFFYECQQADELPEWNRVTWRGDATLGDEVYGGWYDAGDHVKFNLPMAYSAAMLAWGLYQYPEGVEACGEMESYVNNLTFVLDYLAACDLGDEVIYQCGIGQEDHSWWGPAELWEYGMVDQGCSGERTTLKGRNCSAVTAEMAAALAAGAAALEGRVDDAVLEGYIAHAENLFQMADADRSDDTYASSDASNFYRSSHFYDELFWAANWLYIATGNSDYLDTAASYESNLGTELGTNELKYSWCQCWDDVQQGATLLYAINTGESKWINQAKKHLDYWNDSSSVLDGGAVYVSNWGCLRYACNVGFLTAVACDTVLSDDAKRSEYEALYKTQIDYCLGDNPSGQVYVVGLTEDAPKNPHHRTAHASWKNATDTPDENRHILYGALVGGPNQDGTYEDDRNNYINNEVATDYNAGFTALLCKMVSAYGGETDPAFPQAETPVDEIYVETKLTTSASGSTLSFKLTNHTAWPARVVDNVSYRYYVDLSEVLDAGFSASDMQMRIDRDQAEMYSGKGYATAEVEGPILYDGTIYYYEITYPDGRVALPISEGQHQCELLLALVYPNYGSGWDASNDYSNQDLVEGTASVSSYITVYENGTLIYGVEPDGTQPSEGTTPVTTTAVTTTAAEPENLYGDANCDGTVKMTDIILLNKVLNDAETLTEQGKINANVILSTGDEAVTASDVSKILTYISGQITYDALIPQ